MREIKFRGKAQLNEEWIYGSLITKEWQVTNNLNELKYIKSYEICCKDENYWTSTYKNVPVFEGTICQFTGLFDKNGKEIYEGDVVNCRVLRLSGNSSSWSQKTNINHGKCRILPMQVVYKKPFTDCYCRYGCYDFIPTKKAESLIKEYEKPVGKEQNDQIINWFNIDNDDMLEVIGNVYDNPKFLEAEDD